MIRIFISYSWEDRIIAREFAYRLKNDKFQIWIDCKQKAGTNLPKEINNALNNCDAFLLFWSKNTENSYWVELEWTSAIGLKKEIIVILLDETKLPPLLQSMIYVQFLDFESSYSKLLESLKKNDYKSIDSNLRILEKTPSGRSVRIETNSNFITIGRSPKSDIQLDNSIVSWEHGNILFTDNEYIYRHVSKTNSTQIKRHDEELLLRKDIKTELALKNNDRIIIGKNILIVQFNLYPDVNGYSTTKDENARDETFK